MHFKNVMSFHKVELVCNQPAAINKIDLNTKQQHKTFDILGTKVQNSR